MKVNIMLGFLTTAVNVLEAIFTIQTELLLMSRLYLAAIEPIQLGM